MKNLMGAYVVLGCKLNSSLEKINYKYLEKYNSTDNDTIKKVIKEAYIIILNNIKTYPNEYVNNIDTFVNVTNKHFLDSSIKSFSKKSNK